jgi:ubiquinone biosynthesis protein
MLSDVTLQGSPVSPALRPSSSVPTPRSVSGRYQVARRAAQVVGAATPLILDYWRDEQRFFFFGGAREVSEATHQYRARRIRSEIERLGIGFIKVGQVISTRGDLLPKPYLDELRMLQDSLSPLTFGEVRATLEATYGCPLEDVFEQFEPTPIATASIGQVHRAQYAGQSVVVKLIRPGIQHQLATDFRIVTALLRFLDEQLVRFRQENSDVHVLTRLFSQIVTEVNAGLREEMDFVFERANAERLGALLADNPLVVVPRVIGELCRPNVLVLEYRPGIKISDGDALRAAGFEPLKMVERLVEVYLEMILVHGVYHADPHPGNVAVDERGRIILYDFGIVRTLSARIRESLLKMTLDGLRGDVPAIVDELYRMGVVDPAADRATALRVGEKFRELYLRDMPTAERIEAVGRYMRDAFGYVPLRMPKEMVYVFRVVSMLEGLGTCFKPGWNIMADASPAVQRGIRKMMMASETIRWPELIAQWVGRWFRALFARPA